MHVLFLYLAMDKLDRTLVLIQVPPNLAQGVLYILHKQRKLKENI